MLSNRTLFLQHVAQTSAFPLMLEIVDAKGIYLTDVNGKKYIDLISGIGVSGLGHCHPVIVDAVKTQAEKFMHIMVYGEIIHTPQVKLSQLLCDLLPNSLNSVYLVNSGAEAIDGAMKLAKRYTGKPDIISFKNSYHGSLQGPLSIMGSEEYKNAFRPLIPGCSSIEYNNVNDLVHITENTAAVVLETIQGEAGVILPDKEFLRALQEKCKITGTLIIVDEVQSGFGRTGSFFAFEQFDLIPDILCLAKAMGAGMPIGAFIADKKIMHAISENPILGHITTFGGNPVCAAAAIANIETLKNENIIAAVKNKAELFKTLLIHPKIKVVRNKGLMMAIEIDSFENVIKVCHIALSKGVFIDWFLFNTNSIRVAPPLIISEEEINLSCRIIIESLNEVFV